MPALINAKQITQCALGCRRPHQRLRQSLYICRRGVSRHIRVAASVERIGAPARPQHREVARNLDGWEGIQHLLDALMHLPATSPILCRLSLIVISEDIEGYQLLSRWYWVSEWQAQMTSLRHRKLRT